MEPIEAKKCPNLLIVAFVGFTLVTMLASFSVYSSEYLLYISFVVFLVFSLISYSRRPTIFSKQKEIKQQAWMWILSWLVVFALCILHIHLPPMRLVLYYVFGMLLLFLDISIQKRIIDVFTRILSVLLVFSIIEYLIYQFTGIGLELANVTRQTVVDRDYYFIQLPFNLIDQSHAIPRFCGLTEEPGLLGTLCGFLLFYTSAEKKHKIQFFIFLIAGLLTFSLAYYIILICFALTKISSLKQFIIGIIATFIIGGTFVYFFRETVETLIVERVVEQNISDLDNRSSDIFDYYLEKSIKSGSIILGQGGYIPDDVFSRRSDGGYSKGIAGAKKWIYQYGLISFLCVFMAYYKIYRKRHVETLSYFHILFLLIFWASFYQRETIMEPYTFLVYIGVPLVNYHQS